MSQTALGSLLIPWDERGGGSVTREHRPAVWFPLFRQQWVEASSHFSGNDGACSSLTGLLSVITIPFASPQVWLFGTKSSFLLSGCYMLSVHAQGAYLYRNACASVCTRASVSSRNVQGLVVLLGPVLTVVPSRNNPSFFQVLGLLGNSRAK